MITGRDIIVVGLQSWDISIGSNCKNIAWELAKHNRVLYVNRALDRISAIRLKHEPDIHNRIQSLKGITPAIQQIAPQLWTLNPITLLESMNWVPGSAFFDWFNRINNRRIATEINKATKEMGFSNVILFNDNDFFRGFYLPEMLNNISSTIYYIRDNLTSQPYFAKQGKRLEPLLMAKSDMVVANSAYLRDVAAQYNPRSYDIGQGCEFDIFVPDNFPDKPAEMAGLKGPVVGYVGALLTSRLDIAIIEHIAQQRRDWNIVLVGPEDEGFKASALHGMQNVVFTGNKSVKELPAYIAHFDVCINPQVLNDMTIGNYPRKVDEYLAMGKPVVATATAAMEMFRPYTWLCKDAAAYVSAIESILNTPADPAKAAERRSFALSHTWENSVEAMSRYFEGLKQTRQRAAALSNQ
ncbi:glycosyltransferase [Chitinophaga horti]|uniref:Glycosyltransferase n=1 Tax=Chitinophaga horti TaxID=2920382 RepID=A0ABY6J9I2_9BACT|nr:glycosyltransferase [Chitinophaga horti]UYQ95242.1 glycosyltransferase [Chitinophaga horti]